MTLVYPFVECLFCHFRWDKMTMTIILNLKVEVDPRRVSSSHYYEVLYFSVSEMRSHYNNAGRVSDSLIQQSAHIITALQIHTFLFGQYYPSHYLPIVCQIFKMNENK